MKRGHFLLQLFLLTLSVIPALRQAGYAISPEQKIGVEAEYGSVNSVEEARRTRSLPFEKYQELLEIVKSELPGGGSAIRQEPWERAPQGFASLKAVMTDPQGRAWQAVPEYVNKRGIDGLELVSPPLQGEKDLRAFASVLGAVEKSGKFGKGAASSMHFNLDVSHLYDPHGDASALLDLILYLEGHWPEIYGAVSPGRYGRVVNEHATPLALKADPLLSELAALPKSERTFPVIQSVFRRYGRHIGRRTDEHGFWKNSAANYMKLFGLASEKQLPIVEIRIADLLGPDDFLRTARLFSRIVREGPALHAKGRFSNPFEELASRPLTPAEAQWEASELIARQDPQAYRRFLQGLRLEPAQYPMNSQLRGPLTHGISPAELQERLDAVNDREPLVVGNRVLRLEAESGGTRWVPRTIAEMIGQCERTNEPCALTIRIPKALAGKIPDPQLRTWAYGLEQSLKMQELANLYDGASPRQIQNESSYVPGKVELARTSEGLQITVRGGGDSRALEDTLRLAAAGIADPESLRALPPDRLPKLGTRDFAAALNAFFRQFKGREMSASELASARELEKYVPEAFFYDLDQVSVFSQLEKNQLREANHFFLSDVADVIETRQPKSLFWPSQIANPLQRWAGASRLAEVWSRSLFPRKNDSPSSAARACAPKFAGFVHK